MKEIFKYIISSKYRRKKRFEKKVKKLNPLTNVISKNNIPLNMVKFGKYSYGNPIVRTFGSKNEKLIIGDYVSIAADVKFILSGEHCTETFTTFPVKKNCLGYDVPDVLCKGPIIVKDDVWIGTGAIILSGVTIGQGAIVGAGAVVTKNIEPYGIYGGVPAKLIKYRFPEEIREELLKIDFSKIDFIKLKNDSDILYKKLNLKVLKEIKEKIYK